MSLEFENCEFSFYTEEEIKKISVVEVSANLIKNEKENTIIDLKMGSTNRDEK
jgi:hypothetical protein